MRTKLITILFSLFIVKSFGQNDSVQLSVDLIPDEIFLTYPDFRYNKGITKEQIISSVNKEQLDFIGKSLDYTNFSYSEGEKITQIASKTVWGFFQNKTLYVNYKGGFYRVPVFGAICYLVATVEVPAVGFYDPMFGPGTTYGGTRKEIREFIINFYDGVLSEFNMDDIQLLLSRDKVLFEEFKSLSRRKQKEQVYRYIRKYNDQHPVWFLK